MATLKTSLQREALKLVFWQLVLTMVLSILILLLQGPKNSLSTFLGGVSYIIPNFIFAWRVFAYAGARLADKFIIAFFIGELTKLLVSAALFILTIKYLPVNNVFVMAGYALAIISFWFVCGWHFGRNNTIKSKASL